MSFPLAVQPHRAAALALLLASSAWLTPALAVPGNYQIVQTSSDNQSYSGFDSGANSSGSWAWVAPAAVSINPFSSYSTGSGTLNAVTIQWGHTLSFSGTSASGGGSISGGGGTSASVNTFGYSGDGGSDGDGTGPSSPVAFTETWCASGPCAYTFTAANAGVTYDPNIWTVLSGSSIYTVSSNNTGSAGWSGIVSGLLSMNSTLTVTYDYFGEPLPASVPLAPTAALLGLGLGAIGLNRRGRQRVLQ